MKIYTVNEAGKQFEVKRCYFSDYDVYLIDDEDIIYLWFGEKIKLDYQDQVIKLARELNHERNQAAKIQILHHHREYSTFLALMDELRQGHPIEQTELRTELVLEEPKEIIKAIEKKSPEVKSGVAQWSEQIKEYRKVEIPEKATEVPEASKREEVVPQKEEPEIQEEIVSQKEEPEIQEEVVPQKEEPEIPEEVVPQKEEPEIQEEIKTEEKEASPIVDWLNQLKDYRTEVEITDKAPEFTPKEVAEKIEEEEIELDFEDLVRVGAYFLSQESHSYDELCWLLAEKQLKIQSESDTVPEDVIKNKAEQVYKTSCTYDELCWLISELDTMVAQKYFEEF